MLAAWGIPKYLGHPENVYWQKEELNGEIDYLLEHIKNDEPVYMFYWSTFGWQYKLGYDNHSIGGIDNNVTYGTVIFRDGMNCDEDLAKISSYDKLYVVFSHVNPEGFYQLQKTLQNAGHTQLIYYEHQTLLWFFCKSFDDSKIKVNWNITEQNETQTTICIKNQGPAWLNHEFETVRLKDETTGIEAELPKFIAPGQEITVILEGIDDNPKLILINDQGRICDEMTFYYE